MQEHGQAFDILHTPKTYTEANQSNGIADCSDPCSERATISHGHRLLQSAWEPICFRVHQARVGEPHYCHIGNFEKQEALFILFQGN